MRYFSLITLVVLAVSLVATAPIGVVATETPSPSPTATTSLQPTVTDTPGSTPNATDIERIDENTVIVASEWDEDAGVARITVQSKTTQTVTFSDAGKFVQGGKVPVTATAIRAGTTTTVEVPVTEVDGRVGVAISTDDTALYSEILEQPSGDGLGILEAVSTIQAWLGGATIAFVWMVIAGWSVIRREGGRPEVAT